MLTRVKSNMVRVAVVTHDGEWDVQFLSLAQDMVGLFIIHKDLIHRAVFILICILVLRFAFHLLSRLTRRIFQFYPRSTG